MFLSQRRVVFLGKLFFGLWVFVLMYLYFTLDSDGLPWTQPSSQNVVLNKLMRGEVNDSVLIKPLADLLSPDSRTLSFYQLPKRRRAVMYSELTTANRDTSYPLAPDFTFHVSYHGDSVVFFEDYGPGCVHRIYLFPMLPTHADDLYKMTADDLKTSFIAVEVDNSTFRYSLRELMNGESWPFLSPFNTRHKYLASGMGSYTPICYQSSIKIRYFPSEKLPANLFDVTINCSKNDLPCPVHIYSAVSREKFATGQRVETYEESGPYQERSEQLAKVLQRADTSGPDSRSPCQLSCMEMCKECERILFTQKVPGVISAIKMRVFGTATGKLRSNWTDILLTATFDGASPPQIEKVPLGSLFGATASLNEFRSATFGKVRRKCSYTDKFVKLPAIEITGYFYFPMPFWKSAEIKLEGSEFIDTPLLICSQVTVEKNYYDATETGYFNARKTYYTDNVTGHREVLSVQGSWGQVVGVLMDVDNLRAVRNAATSNERWAALQADTVMFVDGSRSASMLGTGLEDYFSYAHGFNMAENTTYAFVGNYHAAPKQKEPLTWHCYRLHITDPVYFHHSLQFVMEGTSRKDFQRPQPELTYEDHVRRKMSGEACLSHLVFFYAGDQSGVTTTDIFHFNQVNSEQEHRFEVRESPTRSAGRTFHLANKRFIGAVNINQTFDVGGRRFNFGDKFTFTVTCLPTNQGIVLRRRFHLMPAVSWNEKADIWVNGVYVGVWFIPMGATSVEYSLREDDFLIGKHVTRNRKSLEITIRALTVWNDISYMVLNIS